MAQLRVDLCLARRFLPTRVLGSGLQKAFGAHEDRKYARHLPRKQGEDEGGVKVMSERAKRRAMREEVSGSERGLREAKSQ